MGIYWYGWRYTKPFFIMPGLYGWRLLRIRRRFLLDMASGLRGKRGQAFL